MNFDMYISMNNLYDENKRKIIKNLTNMFLEEIFKGNKVSFIYENLNGDKVSFNEDITFYAASTIKAFVVLIMFEKILNNEYSLSDEILVTMSDLKQDTGIIKYQKEDTFYTLEELMKLTIIESDNTAYLKLVDLIGEKEIKEYGKKIGAKYTMQGKDLFGITSARDMLVYFKYIKKFIDSNNEYSHLFYSYLINPTIKLIDDYALDNKVMVRKYGSYEISYHECGYVEDNNPYYLIILTQLNKEYYKKDFINKTAYKINKLHKLLNY